MDNVTHSLTGLFLSRAGMNRFTPYATAILMLSANAPDADIVVLATGKLNYFHYHRHLTHSLVFAPFLAAAVVAIVRTVAKQAFALMPAFLAALVGIASHLLLDLTNAYGVRMFLPFSSEWIHWDLTNVVDFWILAFFAVCLAAPFLSQLVGGEIGGASRKRFPGRGFAVAAILFLALYDGARAVLHARALAILDAREYDRSSALRVAAFPPGSNPFRWKGLAESRDAYRLFDLDLTQAFDPNSGLPLRKTAPTSATAAASQTDPFLVMRAFAQYPFWRTEPSSPGDSTAVTLVDLRFPFLAEAVIDRAGTVVTSRFSY